jgi:hypothetical protein
MAEASRFGKNKNPTAGLGSGVQENFVRQSEPNRRAAKQRVWQ